MPTYEYECNKCGSIIDVFQSIKAAPLRKADCERCGKKQPVKRLIGTGGAVLFKGSGFYQTDYRSESYSKAAKAESDKKTGTGSSDKSTDKSSKSSSGSDGGSVSEKKSSSKGDGPKSSSSSEKS